MTEQTDKLRKVDYISGDYDHLTGVSLDRAIEKDNVSFKAKKDLRQGYLHHFVSFYAVIENENGLLDIAHYTCVKFID